MQHHITDGSRRMLIPFVVEFFGRLDPVSYKFVRDLSFSCPLGGKGYAGASLRTAWFRHISCSLQRMHAVSFKRNLAIAREEMKSCKVSLQDLEDVGYVNAGVSYFWRDSDYTLVWEWSTPWLHRVFAFEKAVFPI